MEDSERLLKSRKILKRDILEQKEELDRLLDQRDFINAEVSAQMLNGMITEIEQINDSLCSAVSTEDELRDEYSEKKELLRMKCLI